MERTDADRGHCGKTAFANRVARHPDAARVSPRDRIRVGKVVAALLVVSVGSVATRQPVEHVVLAPASSSGPAVRPRKPSRHPHG